MTCGALGGIYRESSSLGLLPIITRRHVVSSVVRLGAWSFGVPRDFINRESIPLLQ